MSKRGEAKVVVCAQASHQLSVAGSSRNSCPLTEGKPTRISIRVAGQPVSLRWPWWRLIIIIIVSCECDYHVRGRLRLARRLERLIAAFQLSNARTGPRARFGHFLDLD